jgi:hypothetical protein
MKTLLSVMRFFHYMIGITAPSKEQERLVLFIWIGVVVGFVSLSALFAWFLVPRILH